MIGRPLIELGGCASAAVNKHTAALGGALSVRKKTSFVSIILALNRYATHILVRSLANEP